MFKPRPSSTLSLLLAGGILATSLACSNEAPTPSRRGAPRGRSPSGAAVADDYPIIVRLVGRHQTITVTAGPGSPLYTATRNNDGVLIVAGATLDQLRTDHPEVYQQLNPTIAVKAESDDSSKKTRSEAEPVSRIDAPRIPTGTFLMSADR